MLRDNVATLTGLTKNEINRLNELTELCCAVAFILSSISNVVDQSLHIIYFVFTEWHVIHYLC